MPWDLLSNRYARDKCDSCRFVAHGLAARGNHLERGHIVAVPEALVPVRWPAPRAPRRARQLAGPHLQPPVGRLELPGVGPEDVVADTDGRLLAGLQDGRIVRVSRDG